MSQPDFSVWKQEPAHAHFMQTHVIQPDGSHCKWGRVIGIWKEEQSLTGADSQTTTKHIEHIYAAVVNVENGDIYSDCRKRKVWVKFCVYSLVQPLVLTAKTVYHLLLPVSIPCEIYKTVQAAKKEDPDISGKQLIKKSALAVLKNLADIARTPLYAISLIVMSIAAVIIGPLAPKILYDIRATIAKIEKALNWDNEDSIWILFPCFQPWYNLMTIEKWNYSYFHTIYTDQNGNDDPTMHGITNFARANIRFRQANRAIFNDCGQLHPYDKPYRSEAISKDFLLPSL